jgi:predicted TIM-barrel fold metal-dependent hydrolase
MRKVILGLLIVSAVAAIALAYEYGDQGYVTPDRINVIEVPRFYPAVDIHAHVGRPTPESYQLAIKTMDASGIAVSFNLSGGNGETLDKHFELAAKYPGRFVQFCGFNARGDEWKAPDIGEKIATIIQQSHDKGAQGFGEIVKWALNGRINWDDPRLEPMWSKLEELHMPVNWHVAAPSRFWRPEGPYNTTEAPSYRDRLPLKQALLMQQERVLERHPNLFVIAAHSNYLTDEIPYLVYRMETYPNYYIDVAAVMEEWGRVPEDFSFICNEYPDRILFGTDSGYSGDKITEEGSLDNAVAHLKAFHVAHFLFLGTAQKMIPVPYNGNYGRYLIGWENGFTRYAHDGVALPNDVLEKIYYRNAERLFGLKVAEWKPETPVIFKTDFTPQPPKEGQRGG